MIKHTGNTNAGKLTERFGALLFLLFLTLPLFAQKNLEGAQKRYTVNVNTPDGYASLTILNEKPDVKIKNNVFYYWYAYGKIMSTMGGYDGHLLDGIYTCFYDNNSLKEKGYFCKGLKAGNWMEWFENGKIKEESNWSNGLRNGVTITYNEDGVLKSKENYKNDKYNGAVIQYDGGQIISKKIYKNGVEKIFKAPPKKKDSLTHKSSKVNDKPKLEKKAKPKKSILQKWKDLFVKNKSDSTGSAPDSHNKTQR
jgi:MORN repeat variant